MKLKIEQKDEIEELKTVNDTTTTIGKQCTSSVKGSCLLAIVNIR